MNRAAVDTGKVDSKGRPIRRTPARRHRLPAGAPPDLLGLDGPAAFPGAPPGLAGQAYPWPAAPGQPAGQAPGVEVAAEIGDKPAKIRRPSRWVPLAWMAAAGLDGFTVARLGAGHPWLALTLAVRPVYAVSGAVVTWAIGRAVVRGIMADDTHRLTRKYYLRCVRLAAAWVALIGGAGATGIGGAFAWPLLMVGGLIAAGPVFAERSRKAADPVETADGEPEWHPDVIAFYNRFCQPGGMLDGAVLSGWAEVPGGWRMHVRGAVGSTQTASALTSGPLASLVATLFDVPMDHVAVERRKDRRSESRITVTVITTEISHDSDAGRWDGESTYDGVTGTVSPGSYKDTTRTHITVNEPGSGMQGGLLVGASGAGKSSTLNRLIAESMLAVKCIECGFANSCAQCDKRRIFAAFVGDAQAHGAAVWRERAEVVAWGPEATLGMLRMLVTALRIRSRAMGTMEWVTLGGEIEHGKSWFDPAPGFPGLFVALDEWPKMVAAGQAWRQEVLSLIAEAVMEFRKAGAAFWLAAQLPDLPYIGERAIQVILENFCAIMHRIDPLSKGFLGVDGDPRLLPDGAKGVGYVRGPDNRSGIQYRTDFCRDHLREGDLGTVDYRSVAIRAASQRVEFDREFLRSIEQSGFTGPGMIITKEMVDVYAQVDTEPVPGEQGDPVAAADDMEAGRVLVNVGKVLGTAGADGLPLADIMRDTGETMGPVKRALAVALHAGAVRRSGENYVDVSSETGGEVPATTAEADAA